MGDLGQEVSADDKYPLEFWPALGGPLQGFDAPGAAELLLQAEARVGDGGHQGRQQLHPDFKGRSVLLEGVIAGPGGHQGIEAEQTLQQGAMAAGGGIGAGAEQGNGGHG